MKNKKISRRKFMGSASCMAVGSTTMLSMLCNLAMMNSVAAKATSFNNDYKALVCIQLHGGNDSFNMLIPKEDAAYQEYSSIRGGLAIGQDNILSLNPNSTSSGKNIGLHPELGGIRDLFNVGNVAFLANIGTLVEPIGAYSDYANATKPLGLFSHKDQRRHWQTSIPQERKDLGWGGRVADILGDMNTNQNISMNISLGGYNIFQTGSNLVQYNVTNEGDGGRLLTQQEGVGNEGILNIIRNTAIDSLVTESYTNIFKQTFANQMRNSIATNQLFADTIKEVEEFNVTFSETNISQDLRMIAKIIKSRTVFGMNRQIFYVNLGGWDNHSNLLNTQRDNFQILNQALVEFYNVLNEIGEENNVTTFTISDFGRTLTSNNTGTDHAWGGHQMVMGGAVNGQEIYGQYPDLMSTLGGLNISPRGVLIPTISTDEFFAELALWFGIIPGELEDVLPNIHNFYSPSVGAPPPIGFMNM